MINKCNRCNDTGLKLNELEDLYRKNDKNCVEVTVISKETGRKIEGLLCKTPQGLKLHTKPILLEHK